MARPPQLATRREEGAQSLIAGNDKFSPGPPPAASAPGLSWTVVDDPAEAERLRPAWVDLLGRCERTGLTQTPDWLLIWWDVYGPLQGRRLRLVLFHDSGRLVGLAPLMRRRHWHRGVLPYRRMEWLASGEREGHGLFSNHLNAIVERGAEEAVARAWRRRLRRERWGRGTRSCCP